METRETGSWVLIFDGDCGLCRAAVERVPRWDRSRRLGCVPYQDEGRPAETGIPPEAGRQEVTAGGERAGRPAARPPPVRPLARLLSRVVADHRRRISRYTRSGCLSRAGAGW